MIKQKGIPYQRVDRLDEVLAFRIVTPGIYVITNIYADIGEGKERLFVPYASREPGKDFDARRLETLSNLIREKRIFIRIGKDGYRE